ncbi:MAG: YraN family protein [Bacteroidaceae bacterium]|nr:YraN family protein [Bacteroidaceae bacterium]
MEQKPTLYTYGNIGINVNELIQLLQPHDINCVVDCRPLSNSRIARNTPEEELKTTLAQHNIIYIPFFHHFGHYPPDTRSKKGTILYKRAINTLQFLEGIERIKNGIQKGFSICIIDGETDIYQSKRYNIIAKRLKEEYHIVHLFANGHYYSQEQVEQLKEDEKRRRQRKNETKQAVGKNGEELAALYLTRNGYQILDRNWNLHYGCELDIVARKDNILHFIEVKTRTSDRYGEPQTAINYKKMKHLRSAIREYRYKHYLHQIESLLDSIAIIYRADNDYDLMHYIGIRTDGNACANVITYNQRPNSD